MSALLAVDTARRSGWAIFVDGRYHASGEVNALDAASLRAIIARALELDPKATLVLEKSFGGTLKTVSGLGAARGCWLSAWCEANELKAPRRVQLVFPQRWRAALFGSTARQPLAERLRAQVHAGRSVGADEAAAVCIGEFASTQLRFVELFQRNQTNKPTLHHEADLHAIGARIRPEGVRKSIPDSNRKKGHGSKTRAFEGQRGRRDPSAVE